MKSTNNKNRKQAQIRLSENSPTIKYAESKKQLSPLGGLPILSKVATVTKMIETAAKKLNDKRKFPAHLAIDILRQLVLLAATGNHDTNDSDKLRFDPALRVALDIAPNGPEHSIASQPTVSRFLNNRTEEELDALDEWFVDFYLYSHKTSPKKIKIYFDGTKVETFGHQEGAMYRGGIYKSSIYFPLTAATDTGWLLGCKLRQGDKSEAKTILSMLVPMIEKIRSRWPDVEILIIVDGAFKSSALFNWCENNNVDYLAGYPNSNCMKVSTKQIAERLQNKFNKQYQHPKFVLENGKKDSKGWTKEQKRIQNITNSNERMKEAEIYKNRRVRDFGQTDHKATSWPDTDPERRIINRLDYSDSGLEVRHVVTNIYGHTPEEIYENYCTRGTSEQWIGEIKHCSELKLNSQSFNANRFRFQIDGMAYMILFLLRQFSSKSYQCLTLKNLRNLLIEVATEISDKQQVLLFELTNNFKHINEFLRVTRKLNARCP